GFGVERRHANAQRHVHARFTVRGAQLFRPFAQRLRELGRILEARVQQNGETVAGDARREGAGRQAAAQQLAELRNDSVADVHAEVVVDDVQLVRVDV